MRPGWGGAHDIWSSGLLNNGCRPGPAGAAVAGSTFDIEFVAPIFGAADVPDIVPTPGIEALFTVASVPVPWWRKQLKTSKV